MEDDLKKSLDNAGTAIELVGKLMQTAGDNEDVKNSGKNLGKTALIITNTINTCLLPLAAVNFAADKAKKYFNEKFQDDLTAKTENIPIEHLTEPKASIAGPALQGLAFSHEEPDLRELYINLLASSMDNRISNNAHPAFVEIIKQLTSVEAKLLNTLLTKRAHWPIIKIDIAADAGGTNPHKSHILNATLNVGEMDIQVVQENEEAMVDNWIRLGLITVDYTRFFVDPKAYDWAQTRPEVLSLKASLQENAHKVQISNGLLTVTSFGLLFAKATQHETPPST